MTLLRLALLVLLASVAGALVWKTLPARTAPVAGPDPIAELIPAEIGGTTQWLLIRGEDRRAPILLWLHGGPGSAQMPIHGLTADLERDFVVVHWDQRGAGKSNPPGFDTATMTLERFLMDAQAFRDHDLYVRLMREVEANGGGMNVSLLSMLPHALAGPEYRLADYRRWLDGAKRGSGPMWTEYLARDLIAEVPRMPVPMVLIAGAQDWNTPVRLVRDWFETVEASLGKRMEVFDGSGHAPFLTETDRFVEMVRGFAAEIADGTIQ